MSRKQRRGIEEFSVSFLDVICCGFGAIILLLMITKTVEPIILEQSQVNLEGVVEDREDALFEIRGQVRELKRQVTDSRDQLDDNLLELAALEKELTEILGQYNTTVTLETEAESESTELAAAKQSLTDEMQRLLGADFQRSTELVGGIAVDSEYIIFVIDTSGSMFNAAWSQVLTKVEETLAIYPQVKGIQVMNDMGDYMFSRYAGEWIPDSPSRRRGHHSAPAELEPLFQLEPGGRHSGRGKYLLRPGQADQHLRVRRRLHRRLHRVRGRSGRPGKPDRRGRQEDGAYPRGRLPRLPAAPERPRLPLCRPDA